MTINELFSGIGAFRKALINQNIDHMVVGISEIDKFAIKSYEALYGETRNYGDISQVSHLDYADLWTYGFPCQDLSVAGQQSGMIKGETRSGLLYEVKRLLTVSEIRDELPKYLIMENVKNLIGKRFKEDFIKWLEWLESKGYTNYYKVLNAAEYGIPQKRERVFVISIRQDVDGEFEFPEPVELLGSMSDYLEDNVDDRYYLSDKIMKSYMRRTEISNMTGSGFKFKPKDRGDLANTLTTKPDRVDSNFVIVHEDN